MPNRADLQANFRSLAQAMTLAHTLRDSFEKDRNFDMEFTPVALNERTNAGLSIKAKLGAPLYKQAQALSTLLDNNAWLANFQPVELQGFSRLGAAQCLERPGFEPFLVQGQSHPSDIVSFRFVTRRELSERYSVQLRIAVRSNGERASVTTLAASTSTLYGEHDSACCPAHTMDIDSCINKGLDVIGLGMREAALLLTDKLHNLVATGKNETRVLHRLAASSLVPEDLLSRLNLQL